MSDLPATPGEGASLPPPARKGEALAAAAHELRPSANAILGFADLLLDSDLDAEQREQVETIRHCGEDLLRLSGEILDLAAVKAGAPESPLLSFEPLALLRETLDALAGGIPDRGVELSTCIGPDVPDRVVGDPARVRKILHALLGGWMRMAEPGRFEAAVLRRSLPKEESAGGAFRLRYEIRALSRPGQPTPSGTARRGLPDTFGFGLVFAKHLCRLLGGEVEAGAGTGTGDFRLAFSIPVRRDASGAGVTAAVPEQEASLRILVVEDNPVNQRLLIALLKRFGRGNRIEMAVHGGEALEKLLQGPDPFDIVFMDVQMPVMDGFECTRRIRAGEGGLHHRDIPIVAVTAGAMQGDREKCLESGMDDYLSKPISANGLQLILERAQEMKSGGTG